MLHHCTTLTIALTILAASLWIYPPTSFAQQPGPRRTDRRETPGERLRRERHERQMAEMELRSVEKLGKDRPAEKPPERLLYEQITEDFQRMQEVNNEMMRAVFQAAPGNPSNTIDFKHLLSALTEINKRASRLKTNLRLPKEDERPPETTLNITTIAQLKSSLLMLDDLIMSFIDNPTFENPGVVDVEQSAKARRDLEGIVAHSRLIKERAEKLKQTK
ncbi:MAG TPA: hypothetical protein VMM84_12230 [Pyrinomonadaceae bacterium]|nr:hypothetical protein [Pyrinomonadaceae bacterium]